MYLETYFDRIERIDERENGQDNLLVLYGGNGEIAGSTQEEPAFRLSDLSGGEKTALADFLKGENANAMLLQGRDFPVLLLHSFYHAVGSALFLVPPKRLFPYLYHPTVQFHEMMEALTLSPASLMHATEKSEEAYRAIAEWLSPLERTFRFEGGDLKESSVLGAAIGYRIAMLTKLFSCYTDFDLTGLGFSCAEHPFLEGLSAHLTALFFAVRRVAKQRHVEFYIDREVFSRPILHGIFELEKEDALPEFRYLLDISPLRGGMFSVTALPEHPLMRHVTMPIMYPEIEAQGMRNSFPYFYN